LLLAEDHGQDYKVLGGFFSKRTREGVWATHGHWIADERTRLKEKKKRERGRWRLLLEGKEAMATQPLTAAWSSPALGVSRLRDTVFDSV